VTQAFDGTNAALEARLSLNQARLLNGQSQLAVDDLRDFLIKSLPPRFAAAANLLLGAALENLGQSKEAGVAYLAAAETSEQDFIKAEALLDASRALVAAGDREAAISSLRTIIESYPESASGPIAEVRLGELTKGS
jgi:TolA-binding protein